MFTQNYENLPVSDIMISLDLCPIVSETTIFKEALNKMDICGLGILCITSEVGKLNGILTEGDIRRLLLKVQKPFSALLVDDIKNYLNPSPITIFPDTPIIDGIKIMTNKKVWDLPVVDKDNFLKGILHLHQVFNDFS